MKTNETMGLTGISGQFCEIGAKEMQAVEGGALLAYAQVMFLATIIGPVGTAFIVSNHLP